MSHTPPPRFLRERLPIAQGAPTARTPHRRLVPGEATLESLALAVGAIAFIVTAVTAIIVFRLHGAPISGPGSIGQFIAIVSTGLAFFAYLGGSYLAQKRLRATASVEGAPRSRGARVVDWIDVAAIAFAHAMLALLAWVVLSDVIARAFLDAPVFGLPVIVLSATSSAVTAYFVFLSAIHMTPLHLSTVLLVFLVFGALASMLTASNPHWWKENLSALGATADLSAMAFNLTLIVAGVIITAIARYGTTGLPAGNAGGLRIVRIALILIGICLACVGIFPVDRFLPLHNTVATGMTIIFASLVIGIRWWVPRIPKTFVLLGYVFLAVLVVVSIAFGAGRYTLTAVELVASTLIFGWIILFIRNAGALARDTAAPEVRARTSSAFPAAGQ